MNGDELVSYTVAKPRKSPVRYYTHSNHLYSVAAITSNTGSVVERWSYNAYGVPTIKNSANATIAKSAMGNDRGFTGYKLDSETGLYAARARMYSGKLGRFTSRDSIGYFDGENLYHAYFIPGGTDSTGNYKDPNQNNDYCKVGDPCAEGDGSYDPKEECCKDGKVVKKATKAFGPVGATVHQHAQGQLGTLVFVHCDRFDGDCRAACNAFGNNASNWKKIKGSNGWGYQAMGSFKCCE